MKLATCFAAATLTFAVDAWPCSESVLHLAAPDNDSAHYPSNTHVWSWHASGPLHLLDASGHEVAGHATQTAERVELVPEAPLAPGRYRVPDDLYGVVEFEVGAPADHAPPILANVGAPKEHTGDATGMCGARSYTQFRVTVTDASPVVIALWANVARLPNVREEPAVYTHVEDGVVSVENGVPRGLPDPGEGHWALQAIDAAGNRSAVWFTPENASIANVTAPPPPVRARGCGCKAAGHDTTATHWVVWLLGASAVALRRRRRTCTRASGLLLRRA